jgi:hypothetical protein
LDNEEFGRYLLGELRWELAQSRLTVPGLTDEPLENAEVLSYSGYDALRLRVGASVFEARLSWRGDVAPVVLRVTETGESRTR